MPPPAQCTIQASRMMARMITTSHTKNSTIPGMAYPLMVLVLATTASYPPGPDLIDRLTEACGAGGPAGQTAVRVLARHRDPPRGRHRMMLRGRKPQCEALDGLLAKVRAGHSRVLAIRGEPGIGKTALLGYAAQTAPDFRVARAEGVESEIELPFAALHQLCGPMLDRLGARPGRCCVWSTMRSGWTGPRRRR